MSVAIAGERIETILFVPGTDLTATSDEPAAGEPPTGWTEPDGAFANELTALLKSDAVKLEFEHFSWSGKNLESARKKAAIGLFERFVEYERKGRNYHIICHSHGGSVCWEALKYASTDVSGSKALPRLQSWTTVGTPFLLMRPLHDGRWFWLSAVFPFVCGVAAFGLLLLPWMEWFRTPDLPGVGLSDAAFTGWINSLREGWRGWLPLLALAFGTASSLFVTIRWLIPNFWNQARALRAARWTKTEEVAWKRFGPLWMGLYDERDEAIALLRHSLRLKGRVVPVGALGLEHIGDQFIWEMLAAHIQGGDGLPLRVVAVLSCPLPGVCEWQPMPAFALSDMRERVSRQSAATLEKLRSLFVAIPGTGGGFAVLADFAKVLTWGELLHTSYFDVAGASSASAVGPFCAWHIVQSTGSDPLTDEIKPRITETQRDWYGRQREAQERAPLAKANSTSGACASGSLVSSEDAPVSARNPYIGLRATWIALLTLLMSLGVGGAAWGVYRLRAISDPFQVETALERLPDLWSASISYSESLGYGNRISAAITQSVDETVDDRLIGGRMSPATLWMIPGPLDRTFDRGVCRAVCELLSPDAIPSYFERFDIGSQIAIARYLLPCMARNVKTTGTVPAGFGFVDLQRRLADPRVSVGRLKGISKLADVFDGRSQRGPVVVVPLVPLAKCYLRMGDAKDFNDLMLDFLHGTRAKQKALDAGASGVERRAADEVLQLATDLSEARQNPRFESELAKPVRDAWKQMVEDARSDLKSRIDLLARWSKVVRLDEKDPTKRKLRNELFRFCEHETPDIVMALIAAGGAEAELAKNYIEALEQASGYEGIDVQYAAKLAIGMAEFGDSTGAKRLLGRVVDARKRVRPRDSFVTYDVRLFEIFAVTAEFLKDDALCAACASEMLSRSKSLDERRRMLTLVNVADLAIRLRNGRNELLHQIRATAAALHASIRENRPARLQALEILVGILTAEASAAPPDLDPETHNAELDRLLNAIRSLPLKDAYERAALAAYWAQAAMVSGREREAASTLHFALSEASGISREDQRSEVCGEIAVAWCRMHQFFRVAETLDRCVRSDRETATAYLLLRAAADRNKGEERWLPDRRSWELPL